MQHPIPPMSPRAVEFFAMFSRMEYALKRCDKFRSNRKGFVEAEWATFAGDVRVDGLYTQLAQQCEANELVHLPPTQREISGHSLEWGKPPPKCKDMKDIIRALRNVRNNLLHGEKGCGEDARDIRLFDSAIFVMNEMLEACPEVSANYWF